MRGPCILPPSGPGLPTRVPPMDPLDCASPDYVLLSLGLSRSPCPYPQVGGRLDRQVRNIRHTLTHVLRVADNTTGASWKLLGGGGDVLFMGE